MITLERMTLILFIRLWGDNMPIAIGNNALDNIAIGGNELDKAYLGNTLLWEREHYTYRFVEWLGFDKTIGQYVITDFGIDDFNWTVNANLQSGTERNSNYNNQQLLGTNWVGNIRSPFFCYVSRGSSSKTAIAIYLGYTWYDGITGHEFETYYFCQSTSREAILTLKRGNSSFVPIKPEYASSSAPTNDPITYTPNSNVVFVINGGISNNNVIPFRYCNMYYYEITILDENNNTVHDLKPAERNDGVLGFYDTVTGKFYQNSGSGTLTKGGYIT